ncbi:MAG: SRPBCC domain-containing protein [Actinobacteria bacterium]|nr:SRPBCC domain-containing protein [Actinomycetota bacterium]
MTQAKNDRVLGTLHPDGDSGSVRVQDTYDTGMDDLWSALTEPDWLARWISTVDGELRLGGEFRAAFFTSGWEGVGRVRECDPPHHFRIETTDADGSGAGAIDVSLTPDGDRTILVIVESGIPVAQLAAYGAGAQMHAEDLAAHVAGREPVPAQQRWRELIPHYEALSLSQD